MRNQETWTFQDRKVRALFIGLFLLPVVVGGIYWATSSELPPVRYMSLGRIILIAMMVEVILATILAGKMAIERHRRFSAEESRNR